MSRRRSVTVGAALVVMAFTAIAWGGDPGAEPRVERYVVDFHDTVVSRVEGKISVGDIVTLHDDLLDPTTGVRVGYNAGVCTVIHLDAIPEHLCTVSFSLPGGTVSLQFINSPPPTKHSAILGGTGRYRGATGQAVLQEFGQIVITDTGTQVNKGAVIFMFDPR